MGRVVGEERDGRGEEESRGKRGGPAQELKSRDEGEGEKRKGEER